jgi:hypothetical protein
MQFKAKDIFRASRLSLLGIKERKKIRKAPLSCS